MRKQTKENTLFLTIQQKYFDQILSGEKKKEYREIKLTTVTKYIVNRKVGDEIQLMFDPDEISEENLEKYANDFMFYNDGVFPYVPKDHYYIHFAGGKTHPEMDKMTVYIDDITFEPMKDDNGKVIRWFYYEDRNEDESFVEDDNGDLVRWQIVYHLGKIVHTDLKKDRG